MAPPKRLRILSLDGGGFRGLSSLIMLQTVFNTFKANLEPEQPDLKPCDFFDLIAGTSTGGIIALMLGRLRMSIEDCIQVYSRLGEKVFGQQQSPPHRERFDAQKLEDAIQEIVEAHTGQRNAPLLDPLEGRCCKTAVFTISGNAVAHSEPEVLRTYRVKGIATDDSQQPWMIWESAR